MSRFISCVRISFLTAGITGIFFLSYATGLVWENTDTRQLNLDAYSLVELEENIKIHQTEIQILDNRVREMKKNIDWLNVKINRIQDSGRTVPLSMVHAVMEKVKKVEALEKDRAGLERVAAMYLKAFKARNKRQSARIIETKTGLRKKAPEKTIPIPGISQSGQMSEKRRDSIKKHVPAGLERSNLETAIKKSGLDDWLEINGDHTCLRVENTLPILFSSGSARVSKQYKDFLKKFALFLKPYTVKIHVNGYTDTDPIRTRQYPSNFELGASRAANIVHELVKNGLKPSIFKIETSGEYRSAAKKMSNHKSFQRKAQLKVVFTG